MDPFWTDNDIDVSHCDVCGLRFCEGHPTFLQKHKAKFLITTGVVVVSLIAGSIGFLAGRSSSGDLETAPSSTLQPTTTNVIQPSTTTPTNSGFVVLAPDEELMLRLVNEERKSEGLNELTWCPALARSSQAHSDDMAARDYFEHASPEGGEVWDRTTQQGYKPSHVGENIAVGQRSVKEVMTSWMESREHRRNILNPNFSHIGFAKAVGLYRGKSGYAYWTQNFGSGGDCGLGLSSSSDRKLWKLVKIVDGDTFDVIDVSGSIERVRFVGYNTPEKGRCGSGEAKSKLEEKLISKEISLLFAGTSDKDKFGRLLRYVEVDGRDIGLELIKGGFAVAAYDSRSGKYPKHFREDEYIAADASSPNLCD